MIIRITSDAKYGISNYLRYGLKKDSAMTRVQKDTVVPLEGNLDVFERIENFMHTHKDYKSGNYYHLTLSFSQQDMEKIDDMSDRTRRDFMRKLVQETLDFYCSGYDLNEIVCYAEAHIAKIKTNEKGEKRLDHIHLAVAKYSPMLDKAIRFRPFNLGIDSAFQTYLCQKYDLDLPQNSPRSNRIKPFKTKTAITRKNLEILFQDVKNEKDMINLCCSLGLEYTKVNGKSGAYYKIKADDMKKHIRLYGKGFEACFAAVNPSYIPKPKPSNNLEVLIQRLKDTMAKDVIARKGTRYIKDEKEITMNQVEIQAPAENIEIAQIPSDAGESKRPVNEIDEQKDGAKSELFTKISAISPLEALEFARKKDWLPANCVYKENLENPSRLAKYNERTKRTSAPSLYDFFVRDCKLSLPELNDVVNYLFDEKFKQQTVDSQDKLPVFEIGVQKLPLGDFDLASGFVSEKIEFMDELAGVMKNEVYSNATFRPLMQTDIKNKYERQQREAKNGYRKQISKYLVNSASHLKKYGYRGTEFASSFSSAMFFDIGGGLNGEICGVPTFTLARLTKKIKSLPYKAMIVATQSRQSDTVTDAESIKQKTLETSARDELSPTCEKENRRLKEEGETDKIRLVVFGDTNFKFGVKYKDISRQKQYIKRCYLAVRNKIAELFDISEYVDKYTKGDVARLYYPLAREALVFKYNEPGRALAPYLKFFQEVEPAIKSQIDTDISLQTQKLAKRQTQNLQTQKIKIDISSSREIAALCAKFNIDEVEFAPTTQEAKAPHAKVVDFTSVNSVDFKTVLEAYGLNPEFNASKQICLTNRDNLYLIIPANNGRELIYDYKEMSGQAIDVARFVEENDPASNFFDKFKSFARKIGQAADFFIKKNISMVANAINEALDQGIVKREALESKVKSYFTTRNFTPTVHMNYDSISVDGESFEYDRDLNFDDEKIEKLNGILLTQDSKMNEIDDLPDHEPGTPSQYGPDF